MQTPTMVTALPRVRVTPKLNYRAARPKVTSFAPHISAVKAAVAQCRTRTGGWRKKDLLRGRATGLASLFALVRELREYGATPAELEGVSVAFYNASRAIITEGYAALRNESLADALHREQECEGAENIDTIDVLAHPTEGNLRKLRASTLAEIEASRHIVDIIDAELLRMESER